MNVPPEAENLARQWMEKAGNDLKAAEQILRLPDPGCPFDTVCFHAQQCAEKSLKALLTLRGVDFERIHDLKRLLQLCTMDPEIVEHSKGIEILSPYATEARYPDEEGEEEEVPITRTQAEEAVALGRKVHEAIRRRLPG